MRRTAAEKYELIRLVEGSELPVRQTLRELRLTRSTFYRWYERYLRHGRAVLEPRPPAARRYSSPVRLRPVGTRAPSACGPSVLEPRPPAARRYSSPVRLRPVGTRAPSACGPSVLEPRPPAARRYSSPVRLRPVGTGTGFHRRCGSGSSRPRWRIPSDPRGNWRGT